MQASRLFSCLLCHDMNSSTLADFFISLFIVCHQEYINTLVYIQLYAEKWQDSKAALTALTAAL